MKRFLKWIIINGLFLTAMYYGYFKGVLGAERIVVFATWFFLLLSFFFFSDSIQEKIKKLGRTVPIWVDVPFDILVLSIFVWFGSWVTGAAYLTYSLVQYAAFEKALTTDE